MNRPGKLHQRLQQLKDKYHDNIEPAENVKSETRSSQNFVKNSKSRVVDTGLMGINGERVEISSIKDAETQREAQKLLKSWLRTEKEAEIIKNRVNGKKEAFYSDLQNIDMQSPLDLMEKKLNSKELLKKNPPPQRLNNKETTIRVDKLLEKSAATRRIESTSLLIQNTYTKKSPTISTRSSSNPTSMNFKNDTRGNTLEEDEQPYGVYTRSEEILSPEDEESKEDIGTPKRSGSMSFEEEEEKVANLDRNNTSREHSPFRGLDTSNFTNESPPKREMQTPEPYQYPKKISNPEKPGNFGPETEDIFKHDKKGIEMTLESMKQKHEESKRALIRFKIDKFCSKIDVVLIKKSYKFMKISIMMLSHYTKNINSKLHRSSVKAAYRLKLNVFKAWKECHAVSIVLKQQQEQLEEARREADLYEKAIAFRDWVLLNKYFMEGFVKHHKQALREKQFQEGQSVIKQKVNKFINTLREKSTRCEEEEPYNSGSLQSSELTYSYEPSALKNITNTSEISQSSASSRISEMNKQTEGSHLSRKVQEAHDAMREFRDIYGKREPELNQNQYVDDTFGALEQQTSDLNMSNGLGERHEEDEEEEEKTGERLDDHHDDNEEEGVVHDAHSEEDEEPLEESARPARANNPYDREQNPLNALSNSPEISRRGDPRDHSSGRKTGVPVKPNAVLSKIEQRAQERKDRALEIKRKHEEQKKQKELEKKQQKDRELDELRQKRLEDKQQLENKRKEELEKREKIEKDRREYQLSLNKVLNFHKHKTLMNYGLQPWKMLLKEARDKKEEAIDWYLSNVLKRFFETWRAGTDLVKQEKEQILEQKMAKAKDHYKLATKIKTFSRFKKYQEESIEYNNMLAEHCKNYLKRSCFQAWFLSLANLRKENFEIQERYTKICNRFRFIALGEKSLKAWKDFLITEKKERIKKQHKDIMWDKVNSILSEYQQKKKK